MRLSIICLSYFLFVSLAVASEQDDPIPVPPLTLSPQQLTEVIPTSPRLRAAPLSPRSNIFYTTSKIEEIYSALQEHGYSRLKTLRSLRKNDQNNTIFLIPTVNRLLQKHLNNIYSEIDKTILLNSIPETVTNDINTLKRLIFEKDFNYKAASEIAFQWWGPYYSIEECKKKTNEYERHLDFLFALYAQSKIILIEDKKENISLENF
jgi:hypothetical protein